MIRLRVRPPFRDDWTELDLEGEHEEEVTNVLVSRLGIADYEIEIDDEGEWIDYEEYEHE